MRWVGKKGCKICGHVLLMDDWEDGSRRICVSCQRDCGEYEEEKEEGENVYKPIINPRSKRD